MTLGQVAYERHSRRDPEAADWGDLASGIRRRWENTAQAIADAVRNGGRA